ncbi:MAG: Ig-like domain-containing protein [Galbitalea sp.]
MPAPESPQSFRSSARNSPATPSCSGSTRNSVALNDVNNGFSWLTGSAKAIDNWNAVPPQQQSQQTGQTKGTNTTYVEKPPTFTPDNHPPIANDDVVGVRGTGTTALPVLQNDTDPDGDVLSVASIGVVPASFGVVQLGGGGLSPQFTPRPRRKRVPDCQLFDQRWPGVALPART